MANVRVTWSYPTTRTDGSTLPLTQIAGVRLEISADGANYGVLRMVPAPETDYVQTELEFGTWFFRGVVLDAFNQESAPQVGSITLVPAAPNALASLTLTRE